MSTIATRSALAAIILALAAMPAAAWAPESTHAGLAEQAAFASRLHKRLELIGFSGGLFEQLTIPPADAPALTDALKRLSPTQGAVPDTRGRQTALGWLAAGAALADSPSEHAANHFYDVFTGAGWSVPDRGPTEWTRERLGRAPLPAHGVPAPDWVTAKDNPFNVAAFEDQYVKAVSAPTPGERSRHMAAALVAAGAMLHTLGDLGAPARVRGDYLAQLEPLGGGPDDLGSRFERIAELAYGRLGVPAPARVVTRAHLRDFFTSKDAKSPGLADEIARGYFSPNTLPEPLSTTSAAPAVLARPLPALPRRLNLMQAHREIATVRDANQVCLARYTEDDNNVVHFSLDDDCLLEQVNAILPEVAAYETGLLDFLFRGELAVAIGDDVAITADGTVGGTVEVLAEDERGVRTSIANVAAGATGVAIHVPTPKAARVVAVYRGVDAQNEPLIAVGAAVLPH